MTIARFINEKILDPFIEAKAIAPRMEAREEQMRAREAELRAQESQAQEDELRVREDELRAQEMQVRCQELQVLAPELQVREEQLRAQESELQARFAVEQEARLAAEVARNNQQWAGWLARRDAALGQGQEFDEPRPDEVRG